MRTERKSNFLLTTEGQILEATYLQHCNANNLLFLRGTRRCFMQAIRGKFQRHSIELVLPIQITVHRQFPLNLDYVHQIVLHVHLERCIQCRHAEHNPRTRRIFASSSFSRNDRRRNNSSTTKWALVQIKIS